MLSTSSLVWGLNAASSSAASMLQAGGYSCTILQARRTRAAAVHPAACFARVLLLGCYSESSNCVRSMCLPRYCSRPSRHGHIRIVQGLEEDHLQGRAATHTNMQRSGIRDGGPGGGQELLLSLHPAAHPSPALDQHWQPPGAKTHLIPSIQQPQEGRRQRLGGAHCHQRLRLPVNRDARVARAVRRHCLPQLGQAHERRVLVGVFVQGAAQQGPQQGPRSRPSATSSAPGA